MKTEIELIQSARQQYRAAFIQMARNGSHDIFFTKTGCVVLGLALEHPWVAVRDVNCMSEETMVRKLSIAIRNVTENQQMKATQ